MRLLAAAGFFVAAIALPALAQNAPPPDEYRRTAVPPPDTAKPRQICIRPFDTPTGSIDHTKVVDAQTILFYMRDGKIWKNTLKGPCRGLLFHGFSFLTRQDEVCANAQAIQVIDTGQVCQLGDFTPYTPPSSAPH